VNSSAAVAVSRELVPPRWRSRALGVVALGFAVTAGLGIFLHDTGDTAFDRWGLVEVSTFVGRGLARVLLALSAPLVSLAVIVAVAVAAAVGHRWRLVVLAVVGPGLGVVLTEYVLKPLVGRYLAVPDVPLSVLKSTYAAAYPSGHETGVATAAVLVVVAASQLPLRVLARVAVVAGAFLWIVLAGLGLVGNGYHYPLDTVGAVGVALAVVPGVALLVDAAATRWYGDATI
jgi:undecaprenyl-diphosphatase